MTSLRALRKSLYVVDGVVAQPMFCIVDRERNARDLCTTYEV